MARNRRVGRVLRFTPSSWLEGVGQVVDLFGVIPTQAGPPRVRRVERQTKTEAVRDRANRVISVNAALSRDVKAIGSDIMRSIAKYDPRTCEGD